MGCIFDNGEKKRRDGIASGKTAGLSACRSAQAMIFRLSGRKSGSAVPGFFEEGASFLSVLGRV